MISLAGTMLQRRRRRYQCPRCGEFLVGWPLAQIGESGRCGQCVLRGRHLRAFCARRQVIGMHQSGRGTGPLRVFSASPTLRDGLLLCLALPRLDDVADDRSCHYRVMGTASVLYASPTVCAGGCDGSRTCPQSGPRSHRGTPHCPLTHDTSVERQSSIVNPESGRASHSGMYLCIIV